MITKTSSKNIFLIFGNHSCAILGILLAETINLRTFDSLTFSYNQSVCLSKSIEIDSLNRLTIS